MFRKLEESTQWQSELYGSKRNLSANRRAINLIYHFVAKNEGCMKMRETFRIYLDTLDINVRLVKINFVQNKSTVTQCWKISKYAFRERFFLRTVKSIVMKRVHELVISKSV